MRPYYADETVTLYLGDCREITEWLAADVLVCDPPYGIGWRRHGGGLHKARGDRHDGIANDNDTGTRDTALTMWGTRPGIVFGSFYAPVPANVKHVCVYRKPPDSGVLGSTTGWRRDLDPVYLVGSWPQRPVRSSSLLTTNVPGAGFLATRDSHPHAKPVDVMETLIAACPPGVIADPFVGGGSTLVAARNQGRSAIGVELDERYCEGIAKRLQQGILPVGTA